MAILVDEAIWPWRGRRWAHLVSDSHLDELHELAHRLGLPYLAFQGDHYDVHEDLRRAAIAAGAVPTPGRELVRALRGAGLRRRATPTWEWVERHRISHGAAGEIAVAEALELLGLAHPRAARHESEEVATLVGELTSLARLAVVDEIGRAEWEGEQLLLVTARARVGPQALGAALDQPGRGIRVHRTSGERGTFVEVTLDATLR